MRMTFLGAGAALIAVASVQLAGTGAGESGAGAPSKLVQHPAKIIFLDRPGDAVTSDGKGAYANGIDGVTAVFQTGSGSPNFLLKFGAVKGKIVRKVNYNYQSPGPVSTTCDADATDNPVGSIADSGYVAFLNVSHMAIGAVVAKQGSFHTSFGTFRFHDATKVDPVNPYNCGALLVVTRSSATTWTVTTDTTPGQTYVNSSGLTVLTANPEEVGSTSQLDIDSSNEFKGNYRMPFFATMTCLSSTSCPTPE